jgi:hypothetical protein
MPDTYTFIGDGVTYLGGIAVVATPIFLIFLWTYFWKTNPDKNN